MSAKRKSSKNMIDKKTKNKALFCSTPEHRADATLIDSDLLCDTESTSPVPFLCTQDGTEGETDVVWNFYTPKTEHAATSRLKNSTPISRHEKKIVKLEIKEKPLPKRRTLRSSQKNSELFQELVELNKNVHKLLGKSKNNNQTQKQLSESEEDVFNNSEISPKSGLKTNSRCLRKNLLSSKFNKPETETALESDDSMNEFLLKASQVVEENILENEKIPSKKACYDSNKQLKPANFKIDVSIEMNQDSMDCILNNIKLQSPVMPNTKKCETPCFKNDSFDNFVENLNDSALERLTQISMKNDKTMKSKPNGLKNEVDWSVQELVLHDESPSSKCVFNRHNSMPESPSIAQTNKPCTSGMAFGRHNSMPYQNNVTKNTASDSSPIRCTPEEIKRKHQQAREKLLAKRLLPFTSTQQSGLSSLPTQQTQQNKAAKKAHFQPRVPSTSTITKIYSNSMPLDPTEHSNNKQLKSNTNMNPADLKLLIEKKRQQALMRLRRRQPQNKVS